MSDKIEIEKQSGDVSKRDSQKHDSQAQYAPRGTTVESPIVFWYDREPERRIERAFEQALPNFRKLRAEIS